MMNLKRKLYRIIKSFIDSPNNRVYVKNIDDYKEYISLRISLETSHYQLCVVNGMIDYNISLVESLSQRETL